MKCSFHLAFEVVRAVLYILIILSSYSSLIGLMFPPSGSTEVNRSSSEVMSDFDELSSRPSYEYEPIYEYSQYSDSENKYDQEKRLFVPPCFIHDFTAYLQKAMKANYGALRKFTSKYEFIEHYQLPYDFSFSNITVSFASQKTTFFSRPVFHFSDTVEEYYRSDDPLESLYAQASKYKYVIAARFNSIYFDVEIKSEYQPYTSFMYGNSVYTWLKVPFGSHNLPLCFCKTNSLVTQIRPAIPCAVLTYNIYLFANTGKDALAHLEKLCKKCQERNVTLEKPHNTATNHITIRGVTIRCTDGKSRATGDLPEDQKKLLIKLTNTLTNRTLFSHVAQLLQKWQFVATFNLQVKIILSENIYKFSDEIYRTSPNSKITSAILEAWQKVSPDLIAALSPVVLPCNTVAVAITDACVSTRGFCYGGLCLRKNGLEPKSFANGLLLSGTMRGFDSNQYIHFMELEAVMVALKLAFENDYKPGDRVIVWCDNQIALGAIKNGSSSLNPLIVEVCKKYASKGVFITPCYIPGKQNCIADAFSRGITWADYPKRFIEQFYYYPEDRKEIVEDLYKVKRLCPLCYFAQNCRKIPPQAVSSLYAPNANISALLQVLKPVVVDVAAPYHSKGLPMLPAAFNAKQMVFIECKTCHAKRVLSRFFLEHDNEENLYSSKVVGNLATKNN